MVYFEQLNVPFIVSCHKKSELYDLFSEMSQKTKNNILYGVWRVRQLEKSWDTLRRLLSEYKDNISIAFLEADGIEYCYRTWFEKRRPDIPIYDFRELIFQKDPVVQMSIEEIF